MILLILKIHSIKGYIMQIGILGGKMTRKVYYVEDDTNIAQIVAEYLEQRHFEVTIFPTIAEARQMLNLYKPDLCLIGICRTEEGMFCAVISGKGGRNYQSYS